ncbi:DMT family transporter [uncultured Bacteroides sp.]|uniref:DMT family transporter n=1 Tax=uncultured Bacteroides sp. TaxID=162156 RepID=UPI002AAAC5DF|nr:DMT family transporter [uncultured Bacteroides sp.]
MEKSSKSIVYASVAVLSWSTVATAFKVALKSLSYFELILIASCTALFIFTIVLLFQKKFNLVRSFSGKQWLRFAGIGLLNPVAYYLVLFKAYSMLPAQIAQPINYSWPILLLIMLAVFTRRPIPIPKYVGLVVSLLGVIFISVGASNSAITGISIPGILLCVVSAVLWASYWMINNKNKEIDGTVSLFMGFLFGTFYLLLAALFIGVNVYNASSLLAGMYVGAFEIGVPFICFGIAIRTTNNPALVNQLCYLAPFMSLFFISIVLGEQIYISTYIGLMLIVGGIVFNQYLAGKATWKLYRAIVKYRITHRAYPG